MQRVYITEEIANTMFLSLLKCIAEKHITVRQACKHLKYSSSAIYCHLTPLQKEQLLATKAIVKPSKSSRYGGYGLATLNVEQVDDDEF